MLGKRRMYHPIGDEMGGILIRLPVSRFPPPKSAPHSIPDRLVSVSQRRLDRESTSPALNPIIFLSASINAFMPQESRVMKISGIFEVKLSPLDLSVQGLDGVNLSRRSIDKQFKGALEATSKGEMLSAMTAVKGSAGYVAVEQVSGSLGGKKGSFVLQHFGTMENGANRLILEVVPNSGSGELAGLAGKMAIKIEGGQHSYEFEYELA
jgi:uncharacterized protein DUF3224